jgi:hypothetical protein
MPVRHTAGTFHGFLTVRAADGRVIAAGDVTQTIRGDRVILHQVFHFKDGSLDDETTIFTQHRTFQLISDRHIQRGPFFPHPLDSAIDARGGQVTVRTTGKDGRPEIKTEHVDLPPDLANGMTCVVTENMLPEGPPTTVSMLVATPKPRLVKLVFTSRDEEPFTLAGFPRKAMRIEMKIDLGGVAGVVAPLIGKQPPDFNMWMLGGEAPVVIKEVGYLYQDGPTLTFEFASPDWPRSDAGAAASK